MSKLAKRIAEELYPEKWVQLSGEAKMDNNYARRCMAEEIADRILAELLGQGDPEQIGKGGEGGE
jgi:hypothetical protein